jgi:hypothetical protein
MNNQSIRRFAFLQSSRLSYWPRSTTQTVQVVARLPALSKWNTYSHEAAVSLDPLHFIHYHLIKFWNRCLLARVGILATTGIDTFVSKPWRFNTAGTWWWVRKSTSHSAQRWINDNNEEFIWQRWKCLFCRAQTFELRYLTLRTNTKCKNRKTMNLGKTSVPDSERKREHKQIAQPGILYFTGLRITHYSCSSTNCLTCSAGRSKVSRGHLQAHTCVVRMVRHDSTTAPLGRFSLNLVPTLCHWRLLETSIFKCPTVGNTNMAVAWTWDVWATLGCTHCKGCRSK